MFAQFFARVSDFAAHHQVIVAATVAICAIFVTWGVENLIEHYFLPNARVARYVVAIVGSALLLWVIQHFVLHVI